MKRVLIQQLVQAAGDMDRKTLEILVGMAQTMAEKFPEPMAALGDTALGDCAARKLPAKSLAPEVGAHQLLGDIRCGAEVRAN